LVVQPAAPVTLQPSLLEAGAKTAEIPRRDSLQAGQAQVFLERFSRLALRRPHVGDAERRFLAGAECEWGKRIDFHGAAVLLDGLLILAGQGIVPAQK